jgi:hypothetical protein
MALPMPKKRLARQEPEQLVFPFELRVGDVIDDDGARAQVVSPPKTGPAGKTTGAWIRRDGETVQRAMVWDAWRKVRVVRRTAA